MARLMTQKAAALYVAGDHMAAGEAANMAKYAAGEAVCNAVDRAIQTHGGNGLANEYGLVQMLAGSRLLADRTGEPRDGAQLRRPVLPGPAEVLLRSRMTDELVHLEVADAVATITLDSEHNRNALSRQLVTELGEHLATADADAAVKAVLVRSAGRVFCSGADLSEAADGGMDEGARAIVALQRQIATAEKPVVVELGGPVRAGGLGIVGAADIVVAAESVTFALTEVRLGLAPAVISLSLLPRLSPRAASDVFLTGRTFGADEAERMGLVTRTVPDDELAGAVQGVLDDLTQGLPAGPARDEGAAQPRPRRADRRPRRRRRRAVGAALRQRRGP